MIQTICVLKPKRMIAAKGVSYNQRINFWDLLGTKLKTKEAYICSFLWHVVLQRDRRFSGGSSSL